MELIKKAFWSDTLFLLGATLIIALGIELFLFQLADYDVYRVINLSLPSLVLLTGGCLLQYILLKNALSRIKSIWKHLKTNSKTRYWFGGLAFLSSGLYGLLSAQFPFWIFLLLLLSISVFAILLNTFVTNPFQNIIFLLLFAASFDSSLIFWMHEESNQGKHILYAQQLAEQRDTFAEQHLLEIAKIDDPQLGNISFYQFWEQKWLENNYLAANYQFSIGDTTTSPEPLLTPILVASDAFIPTYKISLPSGQSLQFTLNEQFKRSIYTPNQPYKYLTDLRSFHFAVVKQSKVTLTNSYAFHPHIPNINLPQIGAVKKIELEGFDARVYRHSKDVFVLIGEPLSEIQVWIANFGFFFSLLMGIALLWEVFNLILTKKNIWLSWQESPIQYRIQIVLIIVICTLFFIIAITTFIFLNQNHQAVANERQLYVSETLRKELMEQPEQKSYTINFLRKLAKQKQCDIDIYNSKGELTSSSFASIDIIPERFGVDSTIIQQLKQSPSLVVVEKAKTPISKETYLRTYFGLFSASGLFKIVSISTIESAIGTAPYIPFLMAKLLSVYVFLLLFAWGGGLFLISLLTSPLQILAGRISNFKLEKQNEKLNWKGEDAIGQLIEEYNKMVDKVEITTQELILREREGAWQIMAKQIAHEINNKLTPIQLNAQFLTRLVGNIESDESSTVHRITKELVTKISGLSKIAKQFNLFAKLDTPQIESILIADYLQQFLGNYAQKERYTYLVEIKGEEATKIAIDTTHLEEVLENLMINAENAVSDCTNGTIKLRLETTPATLQLEIIDNGKKIVYDNPAEIFDPTFSTTTSQTGLGLSICKRIIEFYNGKLSYRDTETAGNCFVINLPKPK